MGSASDSFRVAINLTGPLFSNHRATRLRATIAHLRTKLPTLRARGWVVEIYGPESSGKTILTLHAIASCQAASGLAALGNAENDPDPLYEKGLGVDTDNLLVSQPDYGEQALEITEQLVQSGAVDLVVVDSVAALVPKTELEGTREDTLVGLQARMMSKALRKITGHASRSGTTVIFINQLRQKIGVVFGRSEVTTGGNALKFYCNMRLDVRRIGRIADGDQTKGNRTRVKVVKNKRAIPFRKVDFDLLYGRGICQAGDLLELAETHVLEARAGTWYSCGETRLGQSRESRPQGSTAPQRTRDPPALGGSTRQPPASTPATCDPRVLAPCSRACGISRARSTASGACAAP